MLSPICPSVGLSVTRVNHTKTVEVRIMTFYHTSSFLGKFHRKILRGSPRVGASNKGRLGKISHFLALSLNISITIGDKSNVIISG